MTEKKQDGSQPFLHLSKGHDALAYPAKDAPQVKSFGYGYSDDNFAPEVNGKDMDGPDQQGLETLTVFTNQEAQDYAVESNLSRLFGDPIALGIVQTKARTSIGIKGRGRKGIEDMMKGAAPKISVPTTITQRIRNLTHGRKGDSETQTEVGME